MLVYKTCLSSLNITNLRNQDILNKTKIKCSCTIYTLYFIPKKKKKKKKKTHTHTLYKHSINTLYSSNFQYQQKFIQLYNLVGMLLE